MPKNTDTKTILGTFVFMFISGTGITDGASGVSAGVSRGGGVWHDQPGASAFTIKVPQRLWFVLILTVKHWL